MPMKLPNGTVIYNLTPHSLKFWVGGDGDPVVVVPSDGILSAAPQTQNVEVNSRYTLVSVQFNPINVGREMIEEIRKENPDALIVGSIIAAQAYPGEVVAPVPHEGGRDSAPALRKLLKSDRFTIFPQEKVNNGSR